MDFFLKYAEIFLTGYFIFSWGLFLIATFQPLVLKIAVNSFFVLTILLFLRFILLLYLFFDSRLLTQHAIDGLLFCLALMFIILPKSFLKNYGVVIPVFLLLLLFLSDFLSNLSFNLKINFFSANGEKLLFFHIFLMVLAYLAFSLSFISAILFIKQDSRLKIHSLNLLDEKNWGVDFLKSINYRLFLGGFVLLSLGILSGVFLRTYLQLSDFSLLRFALSLLLWSVCAYVVIDCQKNGIRGRNLANWLITIFIIAMLCLSYEFIYIIRRNI